MKVGNYNITIGGSSNFPRFGEQQISSVAHNTRSKAASETRSIFDVKRNFFLATDYFKKVVGIDTTTPDLMTRSRKTVRVDIGSAEVWLGRCAAVAACLRIANIL